MKLSLAITTYNRAGMTVSAFKQVADHPMIDEIVIVDDCSKASLFHVLKGLCNKHKGLCKKNNKVTLHRNATNLGMSANKCRAVELCKNDFVILFDSDNILTNEYLNAIEKEGELSPDTFYMPAQAIPNFDFRQFEGKVYDKKNIEELLSVGVGEVCMNTCNMVVNRERYLSIYEHNPEIRGTDTLWMNHLWLKAGNKLKVVEDMAYHHAVHPQSEFLKHCDYNMAMAKKLKTKILQLNGDLLPRD